MADAEQTLSGNLALELNNSTQLNNHSDDTTDHSTYLKAELDTVYQHSQRLSFFYKLVLEPVKSSRSDTQLIDREGLYLEEAAVALALHDGRLIAGKFNPAFGLAWDASPGMYGDGFTDDYEVTEKLGLALQLPLPNLAIKQLSLATFRHDDSFLSDSLITRRGQWRHEGDAHNRLYYSMAIDGDIGDALPRF